MIEALFKLLSGGIRLIFIALWEIFRALLPFGIGRLLPSATSDDDEDADSGDIGTSDSSTDASTGEASQGPGLTPAHGRRLHLRTKALRQRASADARLTRLTGVLTQLDEELLPDFVARVTEGQGEQPEVLELHDHLTTLVRYLEAMVRQREGENPQYLGDADAVADACFAPLLAFTRAEGIRFLTKTPVVLHGDWALSVDLSFRDAAIAPVRLPTEFKRSVYLWPALAHEVAHDFYFSTEGLQEALHARLDLPGGLTLPDRPDDYGRVAPRLLLGPWLAELFADLVGVLQMGPAYAIAMERLFAEPDEPERVRAAHAEGGWFEPHPPSELRVRLAAEVLEHLGRDAEAAATLERWNDVHGEALGYYLPSRQGRWARVPPEFLMDPARELIQTLLSERWPTLSGYPLTNIPGFAYLHADHARVQEFMPELSRGAEVRADARLIIAAAVLAVEDGADEAIVMAAMRRSIVGVGSGERHAIDRPAARRSGVAHTSIAQEVIANLRDPAAIVDAIVLGETFRRR